MPDNGHAREDGADDARDASSHNARAASPPDARAAAQADAIAVSPDGDDLSSFGFDAADGAWLDRFREADAPAPLGSIGPYDVLAEIGRGGQGVVYKARQPGTGRVVAVKRLAAGAWASTSSRRRFDHEVRAVSALRHPNVVTVFAMDVVDGLPVFAMEWIDGEPITRWARRDVAETGDDGSQRRPLAELLACFLKVCDGVHHAHQHGLIHRDLKPANVLVDATGEPHVLDFGLSMPVEAAGASVAVEAPIAPHRPDGAPRPGAFAGTLTHAAPEQVGAGDGVIDTRTDVHALGVMLYQMLCDRSPYSVQGDAQTVIAAIIHAVPPAPSQFAPGIPRELDLIVLHALAKGKDERYASVEALADDVRRYLAGDVVNAHPHTLVYAAGKMARRHRAGFVLAAAGLAVLACFSAWAWRAAVEARTARDLAQQAFTDAMHARDEERQAREQAEQVSSFLHETLSSALPSHGGAGATMLDTIDLAARRLVESPPAAPLVEAEIRYSIGRTYNALWKWREAEPHLARAVELLRLHGGDVSGDASAEARLGDWLTEHGRSCTSLHMPAAVDLQREALELRRRSFGEPSAPVAESLMRLAYAWHQTKEPPRWDEAEALFERAMAMYRQVHAGPHRDTASCLHNYGWMRYRQERYAEADALYGEALAMLDALGDDRDPFRLELLHGYTSLKLLIGENAESLALLEETMPRVREAYGEGAVEPLYWRAALATQRLSRLAEARVWYARGIAATCREAIDALAAEQFDDAASLTPDAAESARDDGCVRKLDDIRLAATLAVESPDMLPPFEALYQLRESLPPGLRTRVERYHEHFGAYQHALQNPIP